MVPFFIKNTLVNYGQGEQIGRFLSYWVVVYFGSVFVNYRSGQNIIATFNCRLSDEVILTKNG
jgi:hypothetical protein